MKRILQILILLGLAYDPLMAQGNLQFNQVLTFSGNINPTGDSPSWTVPANKVWKVTSKTPSVLSGAGIFSLYVNNVPILNYGGVQDGIVWLHAGDSMKFSANLISGLGYWPYFSSVIEFNIVP